MEDRNRSCSVILALAFGLWLGYLIEGASCSTGQIPSWLDWPTQIATCSANVFAAEQPLPCREQNGTAWAAGTARAVTLADHFQVWADDVTQWSRRVKSVATGFDYDMKGKCYR